MKKKNQRAVSKILKGRQKNQRGEREKKSYRSVFHTLLLEIGGLQRRFEHYPRSHRLVFERPLTRCSNSVDTTHTKNLF